MAIGRARGSHTMLTVADGGKDTGAGKGRGKHSHGQGDR